MLLNCDSQCCDQMVAGSSSKTCHQQQQQQPQAQQQPQQSCSLNNNGATSINATYHTSPPYTSSPEQNDQNRESECQLISQKGMKRRGEIIEGVPTVVLGSVSINVAHQHQHQHQHHHSIQHQHHQHQQQHHHQPAAVVQQKSETRSNQLIAQAGPTVMAPRCSLEKCSAYSSPPPAAPSQELPSHMEIGAPTTAELPGNDGGNDGCESCCELDVYDYESILTKILNEKKLALSRSSEVIKFFQEISRPKETNVKPERQASH